MNKRITSIVLSLVMLFTMLATAVPVFAATPVALKVTADTTSAHPGDTINYKVFVGAVTNMGGLEFRLNIPSGLTIVDDSISIPTGLETTIDSDGAIVVPKSGNGYKWSYSAQMTGYTGSSDLVILNFACTVDDGASGDKIVTINVDTFFDNDPPYPELDYTVTPATVNVTAAPVSVTGVTIDETLSVNIGQTKTPSFTVAPAEATNKAVSFTSNNPAVATVNATTGAVTGVSKGTAVITVKTADGNFTDTCTVTVSCAHTNKSTVPAQDSTCTVKGWDEYKKCDDCGQLFNTSDVEIDEIPFLNLATHTPDHQGHATEEYAIKCTECGYVIEAQLNHVHVFDKEVVDEQYKATDATCLKPATFYKSCACGEKGTETFENGRVIDHTEGTEWKSDKDNHWHTCTVAGCGVVIDSSKAAHTPDRASATETDAVKCSVCGYVITPALGHTHAVDTTKYESDETNHWNTCSGCSEKQNVSAHEFEWKIDKEATATEKGSKHEECKVCGYKKAAVEIPATGTPTDPTPENPDSPQTGDNSMKGLWIALLFVSGFGVVTTTVYGKKRKSMK